MTYQIAHISDVHWESRDNNVSAVLTEALKREAPKLLVFTGDLVDHPHRLGKAKDWLFELCRDCGIDPDKQLLVIRGNHDCRFWGIFGFLPLTGFFFWKHFRALRQRRVQIVDVTGQLSVAFLHIDSNPIVWGAARGKVGWWEMRKLRRALQALPKPEQLRLRSSFKIALVHHHPLPVPHGGPDALLFLKDAQRLLQFLAETKVDMVLHGHKHSAPYSLLSLGSATADERVIEVLGAGAAVKTKDVDRRGHNFNLICIEPDGLRYVRQFFAPPQAEFTESLPCGYPAQSFSLAYQHAWKTRGLRCQSIRWDMRIDEEGDRFNELAYTGFAVREGRDFEFLAPPPYTVDTGHLSGVWLNEEKTDAGIHLEEVSRIPRSIEFRVFFPNRPTEETPAQFAIQSWDLNACSLNLADFRKKFPTRQPQREWEEKSIRMAVDDFYWTIRFPSELKFRNPPEFEVWDPNADEKHEWLTHVLQQDFYYSSELHTAVLSIRKPPVGFLYRIYWYPGAAAADKADTKPDAQFEKIKFQVDDFAREALLLAKRRQPGQPLPGRLAQLTRVLLAIAELIAKKIEEVSAATGKVRGKDLDLSVMVNDNAEPPERPMLRVIAAHGPGGDTFWDFTLEEGDGVAGRAFDKNVLRCYDAEIPDPKRSTYVDVRGYPKHKVLYSIPLRHPEAKSLIFGIFNVGAIDDVQADLLRQLNNDEGHLWLLECSQKYVLPRLRDIVYNKTD